MQSTSDNGRNNKAANFVARWREWFSAAIADWNERFDHWLSDKIKKTQSLANKLDKNKAVHKAYAVVDGFNLAYSTLKYFFDLKHADAAQIVSSDDLHEFMLSPLGAIITILVTALLIGASWIGNVFDKGDDKEIYNPYLKGAIESIKSNYPFLRDALKTTKNAFKGLRNTLVGIVSFVKAWFPSYIIRPQSYLLPLSLGLGIPSLINRWFIRSVENQIKEDKKNGEELLNKIERWGSIYTLDKLSDQKSLNTFAFIKDKATPPETESYQLYYIGEENDIKIELSSEALTKISKILSDLETVREIFKNKVIEKLTTQKLSPLTWDTLKKEDFEEIRLTWKREALSELGKLDLCTANAEEINRCWEQLDDKDFKATQTLLRKKIFTHTENIDENINLDVYFDEFWSRLQEKDPDSLRKDFLKKLPLQLNPVTISKFIPSQAIAQSLNALKQSIEKYVNSTSTTTMKRLMRFISKGYNGFIDGMYLFMGAITLTSLLPHTLLFITVLSTMFMFLNIASRIYEEYKVQQEVELSQQKIKHAQAFFECILNLDSPDQAMREAAIDRFEKERTALFKCYNVSLPLAFFIGLQRGLMAYSALNSLMFCIGFLYFVGYFLTMGILPIIPAAVVVSTVIAGTLILAGFITHAMLYLSSDSNRTDSKDTIMNDILINSAELDKVRNTMPQVGEPSHAALILKNLESVYFEGLIVDPAPQFLFQELFEVIRSILASFSKGQKETEFLLNACQEIGQDGHYRDSALMVSLMLPVGVVVGASLGTRTFTKEFKGAPEKPRRTFFDASTIGHTLFSSNPPSSPPPSPSLPPNTDPIAADTDRDEMLTPADPFSSVSRCPSATSTCSDAIPLTFYPT